MNELCLYVRVALPYRLPKRSGSVATLPLPDTEGSLSEIVYAFEVLKADGVGPMTNYSDKWPGDAAFSPVFEELNRRALLSTFTRRRRIVARMSWRAFLASFSSFPTTRRAPSPASSTRGSWRVSPNIRFILSHADGTVPILAGCIQAGAAFFGLEKIAPDGVEQELRRLYFDVANSANRVAFPALTSLVPPSQILFGYRLSVCRYGRDNQWRVDPRPVHAGNPGDPSRQRCRVASAPQGTRHRVASHLRWMTASNGPSLA